MMHLCGCKKPEGGCMQVDINIVTIKKTKKISNKVVHTLNNHITQSGNQ